MDASTEDGASAHDALMGDAVQAAAAAVPAAPSFREALIDDALAAALLERRPGARIALRNHLPLIDWERLPPAARPEPKKRECDLALTAPDADDPCLLSEQKVEDLDSSPFDVAKLLSFARLPGVISTYLVAAETPERFELDKPGCALYSTGARDWELSELVAGAWHDNWDWHVRKATIAPTRLPRRFRTTLIARAAIPAFAPHELRGVRVDSDFEAPQAHLRQGRQLFEEPPELDAELEARMICDEVERRRSG